jgi:succinyl-diaminopimelate desuccinylase
VSRPATTAGGDPVPLARELVRRPSVTPADAGALALVEDALRPLGFACERMRFEAPGTEPVENLWARIGTRAPLLCFAGHVDVVPPGPAEGWSVDPFAGEIADGVLYGRGAADMKGAIACFVAAVHRYLSRRARPPGSIALLLTGDEEGPAVNGTKRVLEALEARGERIDACIVGEPTNPTAIGEVVKIGRRGSLTGRLTVRGTQGHVAYPQRADNPLPRLVRMLASLASAPLDSGNAHFEPSSLQITTIDVGNPATNVIPAEGRAVFNIRFNPLHTPDGLKAWAARRLDAVGGDWTVDWELSGDAFLTAPGPWTEVVAKAVEAVCGRRPALDTGGGTSDARFIRNHCPVVEFGGVGRTMHRADEQQSLADLERLTQIYLGIIDGFFARMAA